MQLRFACLVLLPALAACALAEHHVRGLERRNCPPLQEFMRFVVRHARHEREDATAIAKRGAQDPLFSSLIFVLRTSATLSFLTVRSLSSVNDAV